MLILTIQQKIQCTECHGTGSIPLGLEKEAKRIDCTNCNATGGTENHFECNIPGEVVMNLAGKLDMILNELCRMNNALETIGNRQ